MPCSRLHAVLVAALPLSACVAYVPGSLQAGHDTYDVRRVGCLEIAVRALRDPVLAFTVGNACRYPVGVDVRKLTVRAWAHNGEVFHPTPSDPRGELFEGVLDGHSEASFAIDFPVRWVTPTFCVDVGRLNADTPASHPEEMCFETRETGSPVAVSEREARP